MKKTDIINLRLESVLYNTENFIFSCSYDLKGRTREGILRACDDEGRFNLGGYQGKLKE